MDPSGIRSDGDARAMYGHFGGGRGADIECVHVPTLLRFIHQYWAVCLLPNYELDRTYHDCNMS
jgi:hypothetical protein